MELASLLDSWGYLLEGTPFFSPSLLLFPAFYISGYCILISLKTALNCMSADLLPTRESPGTKHPFLPQLQDGSLFLAQAVGPLLLPLGACTLFGGMLVFKVASSSKWEPRFQERHTLLTLRCFPGPGLGCVQIYRHTVIAGFLLSLTQSL